MFWQVQYIQFLQTAITKKTLNNSMLCKTGISFSGIPRDDFAPQKVFTKLGYKYSGPIEAQIPQNTGG